MLVRPPSRLARTGRRHPRGSRRWFAGGPDLTRVHGGGRPGGHDWTVNPLAGGWRAEPLTSLFPPPKCSRVVSKAASPQSTARVPEPTLLLWSWSRCRRRGRILDRMADRKDRLVAGLQHSARSRTVSDRYGDVPDDCHGPFGVVRAIIRSEASAVLRSAAGAVAGASSHVPRCCPAARPRAVFARVCSSTSGRHSSVAGEVPAAHPSRVVCQSRQGRRPFRRSSMQHPRRRRRVCNASPVGTAAVLN